MNSTGIFGNIATSGVEDLEAERETSLKSKRTAVNEKSHSGPAFLSQAYILRALPLGCHQRNLCIT